MEPGVLVAFGIIVIVVVVVAISQSSGTSRDGRGTSDSGVGALGTGGDSGGSDLGGHHGGGHDGSGGHGGGDDGDDRRTDVGRRSILGVGHHSRVGRWSGIGGAVHAVIRAVIGRIGRRIGRDIRRGVAAGLRWHVVAWGRVAVLVPSGLDGAALVVRCCIGVGNLGRRVRRAVAVRVVRRLGGITLPGFVDPEQRVATARDRRDGQESQEPRREDRGASGTGRSRARRRARAGRR